MTEEQSDTTVLLDYTGAGVWNEAQRKEATQINNALKYWQDLAVANRKVAEDAQAQRDKLAEALEEIAGAYANEEPISARWASETLKECGK